jgi:hypothetical protein
VRLPQRYFAFSTALTGSTSQDTSALIYPFRHSFVAVNDAVQEQADETTAPLRQKIMQATQLYEFSLRYYVAGLNYAGSPYAFHTIGSTIAVNSEHYAKVRGFPRRNAGEDFYLLNKLAKVGCIRQLNAVADCEPVDIAARLSDRVPFGTGAATGRIMELTDPARDFLFYHPTVFELLRSWLGSLPAFWQSRSSDITSVLSQPDLPVLIEGLEDMGVEDALRHALRQSSDAEQFSRQMHTWFDAFRTLKLIHHLRDRQLPSIRLEVLMKKQELYSLLELEPELPRLHRVLKEDWPDHRGRK